MRGRTRCALAACVLWLLMAVPARAQLPVPLPIPGGGQGPAVQPYGTNDAGGFRNVLPPGEAGVDNAVQLAQFLTAHQRPPHWDDQQPLYQNLMYASPTLTHDQIASYYKDATFGVKPGDVESTTSFSDRPGVTILRDKSFGVPHVYGNTREDVVFGAGYAAAQDRLFLIDVLRHTARAQLSSFIGGSKSDREMDRTQWSIAPYTEQDLQSQLDNAEADCRAEGSAFGVPPDQCHGVASQFIADANSFVAGINEYINQAQLDPTKLPAEYAALGKLPQPFTATDVIAEASLIGGIFGKGGGSEVNSALALQALQKRFGATRGKRAWADFREKNDPETATTVSRRFPYETTNPFAKRGLALPDPGTVTDAPPGPSLSSASAAGSSSATSGRYGDIGGALRKALGNGPPHASNWELVSAAHSSNGHPIAVMGPQVGYYVPEILMEEDLHGPGFDAEGAAFPGVNLYVELGHGRDYAWSATTATSDNVDTFAEVLCQDDFHYLYKGQCLPMERLDRTNSWSPNQVDDTPSGSETLTVYRTVHGIVYARGKVGGKPVAFVHARTTYFHEAESAVGFSQLNDPSVIHDPRSFQAAASRINFGFNWSYVDPDHIAYFQSGNYPQRARGTSPDFPILGTGQYDWQGYDPQLHTETLLPPAKHPQAIDPPYLVSWNNKQAPGWAAADDQWDYGAVQRSQMIEAFVKRGIAHGRKMRLEQLIQAMEEPATQDLRALRVLPRVLSAITRAPVPRRHAHRARARLDARIRSAAALLRGWIARGAHRRDLNKDGHYDDDAAVTLLDNWWPNLVAAEFKRTLGRNAYSAIGRMHPVGDPIGGDPSAPAFFGGWWGYVSKDLRDLFNRHRPRGHYSRAYCGGGSRVRCVRALRASLLASLHPNKGDLYGHGACKNDAEASCFDMNRFTVAAGVSVPDFPLQNRPTFQQAIELTRHAPR